MIKANEIELEFTSKDVKSILWVLGISAAIAVLTSFLAFNGYVSPFLLKLVNRIGFVVSSVRKISDSTPSPSFSEFVLSIQWLFAPFQLLAWIIFAPPWSARASEVARKKARELKASQKIVFLIFYMFIVAWLLGDFGILDFPTLYNGGYAYPPGEAIPQLRTIYTSNLALTIYAWLSPIVEVVLIWVFLFLTLNLSTYLTYTDRDQS